MLTKLDLAIINGGSQISVMMVQIAHEFILIMLFGISGELVRNVECVSHEVDCRISRRKLSSSPGIPNLLMLKDQHCHSERGKVWRKGSQSVSKSEPIPGKRMCKLLKL